MKKVFGLLIASTLILGACGESGESENNKSEAINENKAQFKENTLVIDDAVLTIKDTFIVNDKNSGDKLLAFKYEVKNKTNKEEITPFNVWLATMEAKQDDNNTVNDLEVGLTPNTGEYEKWYVHSNDQVKKGKKAKGIITYTLNNDKNVTLKASKGSDGKELGTKKINLGDLKTVDYDAVEDINNESTSTNNDFDSNDTQIVSDKENKNTNEESATTTNNKSHNNDKSTNTTNANSTQVTSSKQEKTSNDYMTQSDIDKWNKSKPTTHDESQMQGVGGHPSGFDPSIPKETQGVPKTDGNGDEYIDATGE